MTVTCAFAPCVDVPNCPLVGGCVIVKFGPQARPMDAPASANRAPAPIKRTRKAVS